jgi:hypothetical protein
MGEAMRWLLQRLFFYEKFEIKTKMSKARVMRVIKMLTYSGGSYYGRASDDDFVISAHSLRTFAGGHGHTTNSFVPRMKGKVTEEGGIATVKGVITMNPIVQVFAIFFEFACLASLIGFPLFHLLMHFTFFKPARQMKEKTEQALIGS